MNSQFKNYIDTFTSNLFSALKNDSSENRKIYVVKHYNTFELTEQLIASTSTDLADVYFHNFSFDKMYDAYEPILNVIKNMYFKYYANTEAYPDIDSFWSACGVYPLHRSILSSYISTGTCAREEDLILSESNYEHDRFIDGLIDIITKITLEHPIILYINNINKASKSTIELLHKLYTSQKEHNLLIFAAYDDLRVVLPHILEVWESFIDMLMSDNCIIDCVFTQPIELEKVSGSFRFEVADVPEYLNKLTNMYYCLDFAELHYYMNIIYRKIELEKLDIDKTLRFRLLRLYAIASLCVDDLTNALLICNALSEIYKKEKLPDIGFTYYYLSSLTYVYNGKHSMASSCALMCLELAMKEADDFLIFKSRLLSVMAKMSGWHNIFFCTDDMDIPEDFLLQAKKYNYLNHLAHTYIFGYDNNPSLYVNSVGIDEKLVHFTKGINIATDLGNTQLLMEAYRKNIMLSSAHGAFDISNYYYHKSHELIGNQDPMQEADIYKGWGYNCCATEKYQAAHDFYNKAIAIYYRLGIMDQVGEVLYNMSINCLLADDYDTAFVYLQTCHKIVNSLHLNDLRVCNLSKLFGLLALCSYKLGNAYNCQLYLDYTRQFLSHILFTDSNERSQSIDPSYTACDDDLFLYNYVSALLCKSNGKFEVAYEYMRKAEMHVMRSEGNQFFSYIQYKLAFADLCQLIGDKEMADKLLVEALDFAHLKHYQIQLKKVEHAMSGRPYHPESRKLVLDNVTIDDINLATKQAAMRKDYEATRKQLNFLNLWQKITDISGKTKQTVIDNSLNAIATNFNIDAIVYLKYTDGEPHIQYNTSNAFLNGDNLQILTDYFSTHRSSFVTSKLRKNFSEYNSVISVFGLNRVCSIICVPFYDNEKLDHLFISYISMKYNWNSITNKYILDESDLNIFQLAYRQLTNALEMYDNQQQIKEINEQLENAAITDYLTTLLNRDGFYGYVEKYIDEANENGSRLDLSILYIDLDNFKFYNDTFGHDVGDLILKKIAASLKAAASDNGFAVRFGGDEFLIVLKDSTVEQCSQIASELLDEMHSHKGYQEEISSLLGRNVTIPPEKIVSASIGIAMAPHVTSGEDISNALKRADATLYKIKHSTKNDFMVAPFQI